MTVSTTTRVIQYPGDGASVAFAIPFPFQLTGDIVVTLIDDGTLAETPWTFAVDYTLTGAGQSSGSLTATVAPAVGFTLRIERVVAYLQSLNLVPNDPFPAEATEEVLDRIVMMAQQLAESGGGGGGGSGAGIVNVGSGQQVSLGLSGLNYSLRSFKASGAGIAVASDADSIAYSLSGVLLAANNLSDVGTRQTALNNLANVAAATNEHVLTKDTATGNVIFKAVPGAGGGLLAANNLSDVASVSASRSSLGLGSAALLDSSQVALNASNLSGLTNFASARMNLGLGSAALLAAAAVLQSANNLSDVASAATARTNLGILSAATFADTAFAKTASNLSDLANAATARTNLGLLSAATFADTAFLKVANNLSDVGTRQTALNNLAAVSGATNEHVLTKDTATGNVIFKAVPAPGGGLLAANNLSDVSSRQTSLNTLTAVGAATNEWVLTKDTATGNAVFKAAAASTGEANTISQTGASGVSILQATPKVGVDLRTRGLIAGANVTITPTGSVDLTIAATGEANTASNIGVAGAGLFTTKSGVNLPFKGLAVGLGISQTTNATDITHSINQAAALTWTAVETFDRVPGAGSHSVIMKGNQSGAMPDGNVVVANSRYTALLDIHRTVDITAAGQSISSGSTAGNALIYAQMLIPAATGGALGTAPYGMRSTVEALYTRGGGGVNSPTAGYFSIYNGGRSLGAFGLHVDAYHQGSDATGGGQNTTYGISCEMFKRQDPANPGFPDGTAAIYVGRSDQALVTSYKVDYGLILVSAGSSPGFIRGIQLGSPSYANGGIAGAAATSTFDVGIDLTHGTFTYAAMQIPSGSDLILSGVAQAQSAAPDRSVQIRASSGVFQLRNNTTPLFEVLANGTPVFYGSAVGSATAGAASALPALPAGYTTVSIAGTLRKIPYYAV
jgi:hypothetical protein